MPHYKSLHQQRVKYKELKCEAAFALRTRIITRIITQTPEWKMTSLSRKFSRLTKYKCVHLLFGLLGSKFQLSELTE